MPYSYQRLVEWGDCDDFGIVYYPHFYEWFDGAFHRMCLSKGYTQRNIREIFGAQGTPLVDTRATFKATATYGDTVTIFAAFSYWGHSSMAIDYWVECEGRVIVVGQEKRVWTNPGEVAGRPVPTAIPQAFRQALAEYCGRAPE